jgi:hypothetical protein
VKTRLAVWLTLELILAASASATVCLLRKDHSLAVRAWMQNPTPETAAELERQKRLTFLSNFKLGGFLFGVMALATVPVIMSASRPKTGRNEAHAST